MHNCQHFRPCEYLISPIRGTSRGQLGCSHRSLFQLKQTAGQSWVHWKIQLTLIRQLWTRYFSLLNLRINIWRSHWERLHTQILLELDFSLWDLRVTVREVSHLRGTTCLEKANPADPSIIKEDFGCAITKSQLQMVRALSGPSLVSAAPKHYVIY